MRLKLILSTLLATVMMAVLPGIVSAQSPTFEWATWDAQITAHANSSQMDVVETQKINVTGGSLSTGQRFYSDPVSIQSVSVAMNGQQAQQLTQGTGTGQYQLSQNSNGDTVLNYMLPTPANAGNSFTVQINYTVPESTPGVVDWAVVPGTHSVPITSSTATINFPDGQMPDQGMVHFVQGNGTVTTSGNSIVVKSQGPIPANQPFEIQVPVTAAAGNAGGNPAQPVPNPNPAPVNPVPGTPAPGLDLSNIPLSLICLGACILGVVLLAFIFLGGGRLLSGLGGGAPGNVGGGRFGGGGGFGGSGSGGGGIFGGGGGSANRGFRDSPNQNRNLPNVPNDKNSGGGGGFG